MVQATNTAKIALSTPLLFQPSTDILLIYFARRFINIRRSIMLNLGVLGSLVVEILKNCGVLGPQIKVHHLPVALGL